MRSLRPALRALPLLLLVSAALAAAEDAAPAFSYRRHLDPAPKAQGTWTGRLVAAPGEGTLVSVALHADWWEGPGDRRVADAARAPMEGIVFEIRRGDGPWIALPAVARGLDLRARAEAPAGTAALEGGTAAGEWSVRQTKGGEYPRALRLDFSCSGDPLAVTDLRVASLALPDLDPRAMPGKPHFPDRQDNRTLRPGAAVAAVVVVENCGARRTKEVDVDLVVVKFGERAGGRRLAFAQVPRLAPGATAEVRLAGTLPADLTETGIYEVLAVVNPRSALPEVEPLNNTASRAFRLEVPSTAPADDLRDR